MVRRFLRKEHMNRDHEQQRKQLWCEVYVAYVSADNSTSSDGAKLWADTALRRFDERFPAPKNEAQDSANAELTDAKRSVE